MLFTVLISVSERTVRPAWRRARRACAMMTKPATLRPARRRRALSSLIRRASRRKAARTRARRAARSAAKCASLASRSSATHSSSRRCARWLFLSLLLKSRHCSCVSGASSAAAAAAAAAAVSGLGAVTTRRQALRSSCSCGAQVTRASIHAAPFAPLLRCARRCSIVALCICRTCPDASVARFAASPSLSPLCLHAGITPPRVQSTPWPATASRSAAAPRPPPAIPAAPAARAPAPAPCPPPRQGQP